MARLSLSRQVAYNVLVDVLGGGCSVNDRFSTHLAEFKSIKPVDRHLAYEIITGSLRWWLKIYTLVDYYSRRDLDRSTHVVKVALVAGSYQILYLDRVPNRASVNESVEYVKINNHHNAVGYVNGILRQVAAQSKVMPIPDAKNDLLKYLSYEYAFPSWIISRWMKRFDQTKLEHILSATCERPPITSRINLMVYPYARTISRLLNKGQTTQPQHRRLPGCLHHQDLPDFKSESIFGHGLISIQDESSQLVSQLVDPQPYEIIVDGCAGPGGKLTGIYERAAWKYLKNTPHPDETHDPSHPQLSEAEIISRFHQNCKQVAEDLAHPKPSMPQIIAIEKKLASYQKLMDNIRRTRAQGIQCFHGDFLNYRPLTPPHKILLDAPCSGLGVLRRHPEGKLTKTEGLIGRMVEKQRELLSHAFDIVANEGLIIYSVCSFELEETVEQKQWLCDTYGDHITVIPLHDRISPYYRRYVTKDQLLMIYSAISDGMDGFGAFVVQKNN